MPSLTSLSLLTTLASLASAQIPTASSVVLIPTTPDVGLEWRVAIRPQYPNGNNTSTYAVNTTNSLVWARNETLNQLLYDVWSNTSTPPSQYQDLSTAIFLWDSIPRNISTKWPRTGNNGSCAPVLGDACVQAVLKYRVDNANSAFTDPACASTLGAFPLLGRGTASERGVATPQNYTNSSFPIGNQGLVGFESQYSHNTTNLTALYIAEGNFQMLLVQGLPRPALVCQVVNTTALFANSAMGRGVGASWALGMVVLGAMWAVL